ncbi:hypothetical protein TNCV_670471 [Trichonephila clavipes]|nr:hypothetical protein TNCV_670471 [Trichonephila clavipes]
MPNWILNLFARGLTQIPNSDESILIQEHLLEMSTNEGLKPIFEQGYHKLWFQKRIPILYPVLWVTGQKLLTTFPSSNLVKQGFSALKNLITQK